MKNYFYVAILLVTFTACKQKTESVSTTKNIETSTSISKIKYPKNLENVFKAHGGIDAWKNMKSLVFTMETPKGDEIISTNLNSREALLENQKTTIGFDGKQVWLLNKTKEDYKGYDPVYGYNLMFYFYAMPFILADDGINYAETTPLVFEGITYPGIQITYNSGVGETPEDRYVLYYNPKTYKMEWLGYTVNFIEGIDKKELHFRRYNKWQTINGLLLPETIVGYGFKDDKPTEAKRTTLFKDIKITKEAIEISKFTKPENASFVN